MVELKIDPEFRDLIAPLTDSELKQLEENILDEEEVYDPIIVWNGTIIDGYNRWAIIQKHPEIPFKTREMIFFSRDEAEEWICRNQLGRRNLTAEQKANLMGKAQMFRKKSVGAQPQNTNAEKRWGQNEPIEKKQIRTAQTIADELGVSESTVKRAEKFAQGIDALKEVSPQAADKILRGGSGVTKAAVMELPKMEPEERREFAESIVNPPPKEERRPEPKPEPPKYTVDNLIDEITASGENYVRFLRETLAMRNKCYQEPEDRKMVLAAVSHIIMAVGDIESLLS